MLTEKEKHGMAELLSRMTPADLFSLAQTVTGRLIVPDTPGDAVAAVILHTEKAEDLLKRRKVRRDFLFRYLHDKRVEGVEVTADKGVMVAHVLTLWGRGTGDDAPAGDHSAAASSPAVVVGALEEEESLPEAPAPSRNTSYSSLCSLDLYSSGSGAGHHRPPQPPPPNLALILNRARSSSSSSLNRVSSQCANLSSTDEPEAHAVATVTGGAGNGGVLNRSESNWSFMDDSSCDANFDVALQNAPSVVAPAQQALTPQNGTVTSGLSTAHAQEMADTFVKWFYDLLNSAVSSSDSIKTSSFRPEHFFPDANANICLQSANPAEQPQIVQVQNDGSEVCSALFDVCRRYSLTYNPNLCPEGVRGVVDPHGLVQVTACGTLHSGQNCCGTFIQQFGLIRDPFDSNNWKIKFTNAKLISKPVEELPKLPNFEQKPALT